MRHIITLLILCLSVSAAGNTNSPSSLQSFSKQIRESFERKDSDWIVKHTDTNGVPAEIVSAQSQMLKWFSRFHGAEVSRRAAESAEREAGH
jgi:hypothetical protein